MKPFHFHWEHFNAVAGFKYVAGILLLFLLSQWIDFPWFLVGLSALFAWLIDQPAKPGKRVWILLLYLLIGSGLTWLSALLADTYWPWLICLFGITFLGSLLLRLGSHWFMLGWCLTYWFMLMPILGAMGDPQELVFSHVLGTSSVLLLVVVEILWKSFGKSTFGKAEDAPNEAPVSMPRTIRYALVVASVIVIGLIIGHAWLDSDPTMISNAAFMVIGFSASNTWKAGLERVLAAILAIIIGFYLGLWIQNETFGMIFSVILSFFVLAFLNVNSGAVIFFFLLFTAYGWGLQDYETGNAIANERILAEIAGVLLAGLAIATMNFRLAYYFGAKK